MYIKISENKVEFPYSFDKMVAEHPNTSFVFGDSEYVLEGCVVKQVYFDDYPMDLPAGKKAVQDDYPSQVGSEYRCVWHVVDKTETDLALEKQQLIDSVVSQVQQRLDNFARTRNYDNILSAATYATSTIPKFAAEGQRAVELRDETWATLYQILADVQAGTRPVPTSYSNIEPELPELTWIN